MKKIIIIISGLIIGMTHVCSKVCVMNRSTCCPTNACVQPVPCMANGVFFPKGERQCTFACFLPEDYLCLKQRIAYFRRHDSMNACAINDFARSIAPYFANKSSHELSCIVAAVLTIEDQALRFAIGKALSRKDAYRLNFLWHMHFNSEIIEQPYEDDFRIVYNGMQLLRQALRENNMRKQLEVIEKLGFYFENRTIDFIAPLMHVALTKEDDYFLELMNMYLRPYEQLNILVVWDILFNPVKTVYNIADQEEMKKEEAAAAAVAQEAQPEQEVTTQPTPVEQAIAEIEEHTVPEMKEAAPEKPEEGLEQPSAEEIEPAERVFEGITKDHGRKETSVEQLVKLSDIGQQKEEAISRIAEAIHVGETPIAKEYTQEKPLEQIAQISDIAKQKEETLSEMTEAADLERPSEKEPIITEQEEPAHNKSAVEQLEQLSDTEKQKEGA